MIVKSPSPEIEIPSTPLTPFVLSRFAEHGDKTAIINGVSGEKFSFNQTADLIRRAAAGFRELGIKQGDVVAIYAPNCPEYIFAFHGLSLIGATSTTINPAYTPQEVVRQIEHANAKSLITLPALLDTICAEKQIGALKNIIVFGDAKDAISFDQLLEAEVFEGFAELDPKQAIATLPYSSGTTGLSKGVMITHYNLVANVCQTSNVQGYSKTTSDDNLVAVLPFFHIYGMLVFMSWSLYEGATVVTLPRFDLEQFMTALQDYKITRAYIAPPIAIALAKHPIIDNYNLDALKIVFCAAAPLGAEISKEVENRIGCDLVQAYGLTETSPVATVGLDAPNKKIYGSIGPPVPNTEIKLIEVENDSPSDDLALGELCIRGPQVMKGYLNNLDATAGCIDSEGWFHTGDIGYADEDGNFFIVDRLKELIKYKGYQVPPAELEALLLTHEAVADAAVIGVPDEAAGELPKAFIVTKAEITAEEIMDFVAANVAPYKKLRLVEFIDAIPKAPSGKILRRLLRDR